MQRAIISPPGCRAPSARLERQLVAGAEAGKGLVEVPRGIGHLSPAAKRHAMLDLLAGPAVHDLDEGGIVGEDAAEIDAVVAAIALHHGRGLDVAQNLWIDLRRIEAIPGDRLECPVCPSLLKPLATVA
jgi:hypothetical protein